VNLSLFAPRTSVLFAERTTVIRIVNRQTCLTMAVFRHTVVSKKGQGPDALMTPISIVAHLALFATVGFLFLFVALLLGRFLRAYAPSEEKLQAYECGEPAVGSSFVQFDLRFYVVALVFIIFEVEVAFFFPWATVFGWATQPIMAEASMATAAAEGAELPAASSDVVKVVKIALTDSEDARRLAMTSMVDIGVFFGVLLVGFAYVWYRGDLNWVRAIGQGG